MVNVPWDGMGQAQIAMGWEWVRQICPVDNRRLVHGNVIPMGIPWEMSHGIGWDRHKLLWDGNGIDKYVPCTALSILQLLLGCSRSLVCLSMF